MACRGQDMAAATAEHCCNCFRINPDIHCRACGHFRDPRIKQLMSALSISWFDKLGIGDSVTAGSKKCIAWRNDACTLDQERLDS
jgi:hypothetical protein